MARLRPLTAEQWYAAADPGRLLYHLRARHSLTRAGGHRRKLRLLGCAAARAVWPHLPEACRAVVVSAEKHADTEVRRTVLRAAHAAAADRRADSPIRRITESFQTFLWLFGASSPEWNRQREALALAGALAATQFGAIQTAAALRAAALIAEAATGDRQNAPARLAAAAHQADLVRDLFGDPFALVAVRPEWRTPAVLGLARAAHREAAFDRLPILADAMEEAGCEDAGLLGHCRGGGVHARGCWVVDGVLGRGVRWANPAPPR